MQKLRNQFPVLRNQIYANTPVYGPMYDDLLDWRQEHDLDFLLKASDMREQSLQIIASTRTTVGNFFGCNGDDVSLVGNFSTGLNLLLEGMDKKERVLLLEGDYPSVNWPFESRNFSIHYAKINAGLEQNIEQLVKEAKSTVLALSLVQWQDGIKIDLDFLKALKNDHPGLLIIADGTQFCGTANFNFKGSGIDVMGASAYKWLLSGYGNGFMLFSGNAKDRLAITTSGFNAADGDFNKKQHLAFNKRFEPGHLSCLAFGSLKFSLDFISAIGKDKIEDHNKTLSQKAKNEFTALSLLSDDVVSRASHSTIFNIKGDGAVFKKLLDNNVVCVQRGAGIRLGFHFYNTENDIDEIVRILKTER